MTAGHPRRRGKNLRGPARSRQTMCEGKVPFADELEAYEAALATRSYKGEHVHQYHCDFCRKWHIGHTSRAVQRRSFARARRQLPVDSTEKPSQC